MGQSFCFGLARAEWKIENGEWRMENGRDGLVFRTILLWCTLFVLAHLT